MKRKYLFIIPLCIILILFSGCTKKNSAESDLKNYIKYWQAKDYENMYNCLSSDSKKYITKEDFEKRYSDIYSSIDGKDIKISYKLDSKSINKKDTSISVPYDFKMTTIAGDTDFQSSIVLIKENIKKSSKWGISWSEQMIFPYLEKGDKVRINTTKAKRGDIVDRKGNAIAYNSDIYSVGIVPNKLGTDKNSIISSISKIIGISEDQIKKSLSASWVKDGYFVPIGNISTEDTKTKDALLQCKGVLIQKIEGRVYPFKEATSQLSGYIGPITKDELNTFKDIGYSENDYIGKAGLEKVFESKLRGKDGKEIYTVGSDEKKKKTIAKMDAVNGETIKLTIDTSIQKYVYNEINNDKGACVVINPQTGEILAAVSSPAYDPNLFILGFKNNQYKDLLDNTGKPFTSRFLQAYTPGSIFKPITAGIGLTLNKINSDEKMTLNGLKWQNDKSWGNYFVTRVRDTGNPVDLTKALIYSDNIYFAKAALKIGSSDLIKGAKQFGIGEKITFELNLDSSYIDNTEKISSDIQLCDSGYGQGKVMVTPINIATAYTAFVNNGNVIKPNLIIDDNKKLPEILHENAISSESSKKILDALVQVVSSPDGTCHDAAINGAVVAGKTGTAELKTNDSDKVQRMNGWFVGFRQDKPNLLAVMMIEDVQGRGESHYVVPLVRKIIENFN